MNTHRNNKKYCLDFARNTLYNIIIVNRITWKNKLTATQTIFWLIPAYGREYHSAADAILDWQAGKDFQIFDLFGPYCSIRDLAEIKKEYSDVRLCISSSYTTFIAL